jgi:thioredoxin-related protein
MALIVLMRSGLRVHNLPVVVMVGLLIASGLSSMTMAADPLRNPGGIAWTSSLEDALEEARIEGRIVMVDFYTDWCHWCRRLDSDTYANAEVVSLATRLVSVKVHAEKRPEVAKAYKVSGYPSIAFLRGDGSLVEMVRGYQPAQAFAAIIKRLTDTGAERFVLLQRLKDHPELVDVRWDLATLLMRAGEDGSALAQVDTLLVYESSIEEGRKWDLYLLRGRLLLAGGRPGDARKDLKLYVDKRKTSPRQAEAIYFLAEACLADGDRKAARKGFKKVVGDLSSGWLVERSRMRLRELG